MFQVQALNMVERFPMINLFIATSKSLNEDITGAKQDIGSHTNQRVKTKKKSSFT